MSKLVNLEELIDLEDNITLQGYKSSEDDSDLWSSGHYDVKVTISELRIILEKLIELKQLQEV